MLSITKPHVRTQQQNIYTAEGEIKFTLFWNRYSDRVATFSSIENPYEWENGFCSYLGFATKAVAIAWQSHLLRIGVATSAEYRKVNRLKVDKPKNCAIRWELKVRGLSYRQLLHLLTCDLAQVPPQPEKKITAHDFEVCDRVKVINTYAGATDWRIGRSGSVVSRDIHTNTIEVKVDGQKFGTLLLKPEWAVKVDAVEFPNCCELPEPAAPTEEPQPEVVEAELEQTTDTEKSLAAEMTTFQVGDRVEVDSNRHGDEFVWEIGIVSAASKVGCAVNVKGQLRWFCNDELRMVEKAPQVREAVDDLFPPLEQPHTTTKLPFNYNSTPQGRRGAVANWNARLASGRGVSLSTDDGMEKWRRMEQEQKLATAVADDDDDIDF